MHLQNRTILLLDWTNTLKRNAFSNHVHISETEIDYEIFNYSIWHSIFTAAFKHKADAVILCADNSSWRKIIYPPYKMNRRLDSKRKKERNEPSIDWDDFFRNANEFTDILVNNIPLIYISEPNCEADDIIAVLSKELHSNNKIVIVSSDSDYKQLLSLPNVRQWDPYPTKQKFVQLDCDPEDWVNVMALHGQAKDNIYNVFTRLDFPLEYNVMRESKEIKPIRKPLLSESKAWEIVKSGKLEQFLQVDGPAIAKKKNAQIKKELSKKSSENECTKVFYEEDVQKRFKTNKIIIGFDSIPKTLTERIKNRVDTFEISRNEDFYTFFKNMHWQSCLDDYEKFERLLNRFF